MVFFRNKVIALIASLGCTALYINAWGGLANSKNMFRFYYGLFTYMLTGNLPKSPSLNPKLFIHIIFFDMFGKEFE